MRLNLLEMVQDILSSLDSDEVNGIADTVEAQQVATIIKTVYNDIISRANLPEHFDLFELNASGDPDKPTVMFRPDRVQSLLWLKYDKRSPDETESNFQMVKYLKPLTFLDFTNGYRQSPANDIERFTLSTANASSIEIIYLNNKAPDYYTSWDDHTIVFDSYDNEVDTTLMKNKTMAYGEFEPTFVMKDDFVPDLDSRQFSLLFNEAKAQAFAELKQSENARAEKQARRAWVTLSHQKANTPQNYPYLKTLPDYGRKRR